MDGTFAIDEYRPMRVAIIGAGASGILAGIRFQQYVPNLQMSIYEQMDGIGGTWYLNKYPGVACDVPSHIYQFSFEQKHDWSSLYAPGSEILDYLRGIVDKYALQPYIKLRHELTVARYDEPSGQWKLRIKRPSKTTPGSYEEVDDWADFVFNGIGSLHRWNWPDIPGLSDFKGTKVHSADWNLGGVTWKDDVKDWGNKKVAVIGLGSSALQIVGALGPHVGKLHNFVRGKAWVSPPFLEHTYREKLGRNIDGTDPNSYAFGKGETDVLQDPGHLMAFRRELEHHMNGMHKVTFSGSAEQGMARELFTAHMKKALEKRPGLADALIPEYSVCCRRLTPAPGFLNAVCNDNYELVTSQIRRVTSRGIETEDGQYIELDVIICATGFNTTYRLPFPIIGRHGVDLAERWTPHPSTYLSICTDGFPNMFFSNGPNSAIGTTALIVMMEHQVMYAVMAATKLQRERLKSIEAKPEAVQDFNRYAQDYFKKTVFVESVRSWYKPNGDGHVVGLWPGSGLHHFRALRHPRWEDFSYESFDKTNNRFYWLGSGITDAENKPVGDRTWYLAPDYVDTPPIPEARSEEHIPLQSPTGHEIVH